MESKLTLKELVTLLAQKSEKRNDDAERFVKELVAVIIDGLSAEGKVKMKGIGTFKTVAVEPRESIDVNTGRRFMIPAHLKLSFTPEKELCEAVNSPFAFFETIELNDNVDFSDIDIAKESEGILNEKSDETEDIEAEDTEFEEIPRETDALIPAVPVNQKALDDNNIPTNNNLVGEDETINQPTIDNPEVKNITPEIEPIQELQDDLKPEPVSESVEKLSSEQTQTPIVESVTKDAETIVPKKISSKSNSKELFLLVAIFLLLIAIGGGLYYIYTREPIVLPQPKTSVDPVVLYKADTTTTALQDSALQDSALAKSDSVVAKTDTVASEPEVIGVEKTVVGSRLAYIARKYYGHKFFWVYIYEYNKALIKDPNNIPIGVELKIPSPKLYGIDAKDSHSVELASQKQTEILNHFQ